MPISELEKLYLQRTSELDQGWEMLVDKYRELTPEQGLTLVQELQQLICARWSSHKLQWMAALTGCAIIEVMRRSYELDQADTELEA